MDIVPRAGKVGEMKQMAPTLKELTLRVRKARSRKIPHNTRSKRQGAPPRARLIGGQHGCRRGFKECSQAGI